jgi:hypothetical protein
MKKEFLIFIELWKLTIKSAEFAGNFPNNNIRFMGVIHSEKEKEDQEREEKKRLKDQTYVI